jgi:hypothetical protein
MGLRLGKSVQSAGITANRKSDLNVAFSIFHSATPSLLNLATQILNPPTLSGNLATLFQTEKPKFST